MKSLLVTLFVLSVSIGAWACPFCNPGESDVFGDIADATAVVLVKKLEARKYKVVETLSGDVKVGRVVVAAEPQGTLGKTGHLLLTTAGPANLPYWSDPPRRRRACLRTKIFKATGLERRKKVGLRRRPPAKSVQRDLPGSLQPPGQCAVARGTEPRSESGPCQTLELGQEPENRSGKTSALHFDGLQVIRRLRSRLDQRHPL